MSNQRKGLSRRAMLEASLGIGALSVLGGPAFAQEVKRMITPETIMGPFYPVLKPLDQDADLTLVAGNKTRAAGKIVHVTGRVLNQKGEPVKGAKIEIWQANTHGRYSHPSDPYDAPLDLNFQGYTILTTDAQGRYRFKTIKPGAYPATQTWMRPPHIHFDVIGKKDRLSTQMFFPNEPLNEKDQLWMDMGPDKMAAVAQVMPSTKEIAAEELLLGWDIILAKG